MRRSSRLGGIARRDLLRAGFGSLVLGASGNFERSPFWAQASAAPTAQEGRILVVVELSGGNDGLNTVVPYGDDAYYLNALAGDRRTMACSFDPDLDWVRATWSSMAVDPRVPIVSDVAAVTD